MKLEEYILQDADGEYTRKVWYLPATSKAEKLAVFLDGEYSVQRLDTPELIIRLHQEGLIPDMACLFVSHVSSEERHRDFTCNESYARFIATDAIRWLRERNPDTAAAGHLLAGISLSGLQAAYTALLHPRVFGFTLAQSGSFWWEKEWLKQHLTELEKPQGRFWIGVGEGETGSGRAFPPSGMLQEIDQITACQNLAEALGERGGTVKYHLHPGIHELGAWKEELPKALAWMFSASALPSGQ